MVRVTKIFQVELLYLNRCEKDGEVSTDTTGIYSKSLHVLETGHGDRFPVRL